MNRLTQKDHKERINTVINYLFKNLLGDVSLEKLSSVANYSPFHLQKVFKQVQGKTPKQYIIQLRLESALHLLVIQTHKSILEISMDCGFSSPAVFSRAFRNFFGTSPEKVRNLDQKEKLKVLKKLNINPSGLKNKKSEREPSVLVKKVEAQKGIYLLAPFHEPAKIQQAFKDLIRIAKSNDLYSSDSKLYGIISPHHGHTYMAFLSLSGVKTFSPKFNFTEIKAGKYVSIKTKGKTEATIKAVHDLFQKWIPESGYRVANEVIGFEIFSGDPSVLSYDDIEREIHIPIVAS
jgi:AraC family transcriptional regulator